jgi:hypothetical protein
VYPLFLPAVAHSHPNAARMVQQRLGRQRESAKAPTFFKKDAVVSHSGARYRMRCGRAPRSPFCTT